MAGYRRQSAAEMEVQEYLAKARAGLAGVNPKAQTLARSGGNPQAQQYGQELVARQLQENAARREVVAAERARAEEQRRQEEARVREVKRQEEARAQAEREAKLQKWADENGALTHRDPQTGRLDFKRHADGETVAFKPGPVGEPKMVPKVSEVTLQDPANRGRTIPTWLPLGDDGGVLGATTFADRKVEEEWYQLHRDERGQVAPAKLEKKTDPRTAETYYEKPSKIEGQAPERVVTGIDRRVKRMQELDRDADALGVRLHELAARRAEWKAVQEPLQAEHEAAKKELEAWRANGWQLAGGNGQPGFWIRYDRRGFRQPDPTPAEVAAHEKAGSVARKRFNEAKRKLKERRPEEEELARLNAEQEDEIYDLEVRRDQVRKGEAEISPKDQQWADEMEQRQREEEEEARRLAAIPPPEPPKLIDMAKSPAARDTDGREAMALAFGPSAKATDLTAEANKHSGFYINRGKDWIADVRKDGAVPVITLRDSEEDEDRLREQAILYGTNGVPLYLRYNRKRKPIEKEAEEVRKIYDVFRTPPLEGETAEAAGKRKLAELGQLGGLPQQILERTRSGELSLDHGEALMRDFYDATLKPVDPRSSKVFQAWLEELAPDELRESWQKSGHDVKARNAVRHQFVNWWYATNKGLPGVSHKIQARLRQELASEESEGFDENLTAITKGGKSLVSNLLGPVFGMGLGLQEHAVLTPLSWFSEEAATQNQKLRRMQGRDFTNFTRGFAKNFEKYFTNEGSQERGELMRALWNLKEVIDTPESAADYGSSITPEQVTVARKAAMQAVRDKAYAVHARRLEKGYEIRPEDVDPELDPVLKGVLAEYEATGDPAAWKVFERRLQMDRGNREYNEEMAELTEGLGEFEAAVMSGIYAGPQEVGTEALSWAAGGLGHLGKLGKLAKLETRLVSLASRGGRLGEVATQLLRGQRMLGRMGNTERALAAAAPGSFWQRLGRAAMREGKQMAAEGGEEILTEFGNAEMTPGSLLHAGGMGAIGAPLLKPVMRVAGMPAGIMAGWVRDAVRGRKAAQFADWHNRAMADTPGFEPLTVEGAAAAMEGADLAELEALAEEHRAAQEELTAAEAEHRIPGEEMGPHEEAEVTAGETESRSSRIETSSTAVPDSRGEAADSPAWTAAAPAGGARRAGPAGSTANSRVQESMGAPAVESSDGHAGAPEIDSPARLGLRFEPWHEQSERELQHPAAGGNVHAPGVGAATFKNTLRERYGAVDVRLLRLADREGTKGGAELHGLGLGSLVRAFERAFGKRVVFYRAASSTRPLPRGGLHSSYAPNYIAVNADGAFSIFFVLGHELGHAIQRQQPALYEEAKQEVLGLLKDKDSYIAREGLAEFYQGRVPELLEDEVFNDVLGYLFREPRFWQELGLRNGGLTARIFGIFQKVLDRMLTILGARRGSRDAADMVAERLKEVRSRVVEMVDEYRRRGEFPEIVATPPRGMTSALNGKIPARQEFGAAEGLLEATEAGSNSAALARVAAGETENRTNRIEPSSTVIPDSRAAAAGSLAWDASLPAGGAWSARPVGNSVDVRVQESTRVPAVEASDGYAGAPEIDSPARLGLRFEPWDEYSERELLHPAAGRNDDAPRVGAATFKNTLARGFGATEVQLLRLADREGTTGGADLHRLAVGSLVRAFERAFGKRVVFYRAASSTRPLPRGGLHSSYAPNYIAVNADGAFSIFFVLGHELGHAIQRQQPALYEEAKQEVLGLLKDKDSYIAREGLAEFYQGRVPELLEDEVFNDVLGYLFREPRFWQELGLRNGGLTARIFGIFQKVLDRMLTILGSRRGSRDAADMVAERLKEVRSRVVEMVDEYRRRGEFPEIVATPPRGMTSALDGRMPVGQKPRGGTGTLEATEAGTNSAAPGRESAAPGQAEVEARNESAGVSVPGASASARSPALGTRVTPADVATAVKAPGARRRLGDVRAGRLHALQAYRDLSEKRVAKGSLSPAEQSKLDRAAQALADTMGREAKVAQRQSRGEPESSGNPGDEAVHRTPRESAWEYSQAYEEMIQKLEALIEPVALARRTLAEAKTRANVAAKNLMHPSGRADLVRLLKIKKAAESKYQSLIEECRKLVEVPAQLRGTIHLHGDARVLERARDGMGIASRYTARDLLPEELEVVYSAEERAAHEEGKIHIRESTSLGVVAHEITHETEIFGKDILFQAIAFLKMRASGTPLVSLREYTGKERYGPEEKAWIDRWEELGGTIYSGKECSGSATEILTKGIERLHEDPLLFLLTDPEYFEFVTRTLNPP